MPKKFFIKESDSEISLRLNSSLAGSSVRVVIRDSSSGIASDLPSVISDATRGIITVTTGSLPVGSYLLEVEQDQAGKIAHYPNKGYDLLIVGADL